MSPRAWWEDDYDRWESSASKRTELTDFIGQNGIRGTVGRGWGISPKHIQMAVALRAARSMVQVLDTNTKEKMHIDFFADGDQNNIGLTFMNKGLMRVSSMPLDTYPKDFRKAIEAINGEVVHEVGHSVGTRKRETVIQKAVNSGTNEHEKNLMRHLANILEDNLIEVEQIRENPGFEKYLDATKEWIGVDSNLMDKSPMDCKPEDATLTQRLQMVGDLLRYKKWSSKWQTLPEEEQEYWENLNSDYISGSRPRLDTLLDAFKHIRENIPEPPEGSGGEGDEPGGEGNKNGSNSAGKQLDGSPTMDPNGPVEDSGEGNGSEADGKVPSSSDGNNEPEDDPFSHDPNRADPLIGHRCSGKMIKPLSQVDKQIIDALIDQEIEYDAQNQVVITKPTLSSKKSTKRSAEVSRLVGAIRARPTKFEQPESLRKRGMVDTNNLHRVFYDPPDLRVFRQNAIPKRPHARIYLLADGSSSMGLTERQVVFNCSLMLIHAFKDMKVTNKVFGYTDAGSGVQLYRIWEPGDELDRLSVIYTADAGGTPTGEALQWVTDKIVHESDPDERKIIIILSDGAPNSPEHTTRVVRDARKRGVAVLEVAVMTWSEDMQEQMFGRGNYIPYGKDAMSPTSKLAKWLSREI